MRTHTVTESPLGPLTLVAQDGLLAGVYMERQRHLPDPGTFGTPDPAAFGAATEQLGAYFTGELTEFDLAVAPRGTPFQLRVWAALREIPYGATLTYGQLARHIGQPTASRAVGLANGRNPLSVVIPCHRVVGSDGGMTGYGGGVERKRYLLALEQGRPGEELVPRLF